MRQLDNGGAITCKCGTFLYPDDEQYDTASTLVKERKSTTVLINFVGTICCLIVISANMPGSLALIGIIMSSLIGPKYLGDSTELKTKVAPLHKAPSKKFTSIEEFKASSKKLNVGFSEMKDKCCICEVLTNQTVNNLHICAPCSHKA
ncbi:hypothetical protein ACODM8_15465 [Vibrio ostreicida]|uniref:hypothetical protein n=1 Tax=Vibrio ostreicida TaxID=526588 RepID=UPI00097029B2|nr:hypothetical protein [Vibrio ostreicida]NPD09523.1 hypothetical protein [Vibrio ostreicida]